MTYVIGIHDGHNSSIALFKENDLLFSISEERFTRKKNQGGFPGKSLEYVLSNFKLTLDDIDLFAIAGTVTPSKAWIEKDALLARYKEQSDFKYTRRAKFRENSLVVKLKSLIKKAEVAGLGRFVNTPLASVSMNKILFVDHHECHAAAAYYSSPSRHAGKRLVITCDGSGDGLCASVSVAENDEIRRFITIGNNESYAALYSRTTFLTGMVPLEHEYKLMGLAPYGNADRARHITKALKALFVLSEEEGIWHRRAGLPPTRLLGRKLEEIYRHSRFDDIALGLQTFVEEFTLDWIRSCVTKFGIRDICLSGGLFMNVKLNQVLLESDFVDSLFVMPSASDESNCIGAGAMGCKSIGISPIPAGLKNLYLGREFSDDEISTAIDSFPFSTKTTVVKSDNISLNVADCLSKGNVVANFQGREEFGARALGNRSILCDASNFNNINIINKMIKQRDFWMPFACSMLRESLVENVSLLKDYDPRFMIMTFNANRESFHKFIAGTHPNDMTTRPQAVDECENANYHNIIKRFSEINQSPGVILNTSFNLHGFPICSAPVEALEVFDQSGLKFLAIGSYFLTKSVEVSV